MVPSLLSRLTSLSHDNKTDRRIFKTLWAKPQSVIMGPLQEKRVEVKGFWEPKSSAKNSKDD